VSSAEQALLREADRSVAATLRDWEQRYGIVRPHA